MARIYKRKRVWYLDIRVNGKRHRKRIGASKKLAELALKDAEVKVVRDEIGFITKDLTLAEFFKRYREFSSVNHRPLTFKRYSAVIDHFREFLNSKNINCDRLSRLNTELIERYKSYRRTSWVNPNGDRILSPTEVTQHSRKGARANTVNFEVSALRTMFYLAMEWGYLKHNPASKIKKIKADDAKPPRFLTKKECYRLLKAFPSELAPIFYIFLNTGMRKSELENLEWSDIDFRRKKIRIRKKETWRPKTNERDIPINSGTYELLKELKTQNDFAIKSRYVFPGKDGERTKVKLREKLIKVAIQARIPDLTKLHTLRHTFASHLVMNGVDLPTVQKLLGHADIETTMVYSHLAPEHLAGAVDKIELS